MTQASPARLQFLVFSLVAASFTNIYITQPVLPVLQREFSAAPALVSLTVSAVIFGIALANLPFGLLADRLAIRPILLGGGLMVAAGGLVCAIAQSLWVLIGARFLQGAFVPALTTCLAAYLGKTLPAERLNVVMGSYVSATVVGGLGGRLLGGLLHPAEHWRYAFVTAAALIVSATLAAFIGLPRTASDVRKAGGQVGFGSLLKRWELLRIFFCAAGAFAVFSSLFNFLPFRLTGAPFGLSTEVITLLYLVYIVGIFMGPTAGRISNRFGSGNTLIVGTIAFGAAVALVALPSIPAVVAGLLLVCAGFFAIHAAAVGALNRRLSTGHGRANALYVLFYYLGGWLGITAAGFAYEHGGWAAVVGFCALLLLVPLAVGIGERRDRQRRWPIG
jgi:YNFM family putative membrane transporter